jgi:Neuraminidase (sialidase)
MKVIICIVTLVNCWMFQFLSTGSSLFLYGQQGWSDDQKIVFLNGGSYDPRAVCVGDIIHLIWWQRWYDNSVFEEFFYKRSTDCGFTWGNEIIMSIEDDNWSIQPSIGVNGDSVHVVWYQEDAGVCYRRSIDAGSTWLQIDTLPNAGANQPCICVDGSSLYVASGNSSGMLVFIKSTDGGDNWQNSQEIRFSSGYPTIDKINSLLVILHQENPYRTEIYSVMSSDDGQTWDDGQCVSENDSISSQLPAVDIDDTEALHVVWYDYKYSPYSWTGDIFYRASRDSCQSWTEIDSLTIEHRAIYSDILAENQNLHLVWEDDRHGFGNNSEIYYRLSDDLGQTWRSEVRLTDAPYNSFVPILSCGSNYLHLFWKDHREYGNSGPGVIYYKQKDLLGIAEADNYDVNSAGLSLYCSTIMTRKSSVYYNLGRYVNGEIMIIDVTGRVMQRYSLYQSSGEFIFDFKKEVHKGIYFVILKAGKWSTTKKVIIVE